MLHLLRHAACCLAAAAAVQAAEAPPDPLAPLRRLVGTWDFTSEWQQDGKSQASGSGTHTFETICRDTAVRGHGPATEFGTPTEFEAVLGWDPEARHYYWFMISNVHRSPQTHPATVSDDQQAFTIAPYPMAAADGRKLTVETTIGLPTADTFDLTINLRGEDGTLRFKMVYHYHRHA